MKKTILTLMLLTSVFTACKKEKEKTPLETVEFTGLITKVEASSYMYGSHVIRNSGTSYALKSDKIVLDDYNNKTVTVIGAKIANYPVDGGPVYLNVSQVK